MSRLCQAPFAGPAQVLTYLSLYTHRVAIANSRFMARAHGKVTFRWRDCAQGSQTRIMTLAADEFSAALFVACSAHQFRTHSLLRPTGQSPSRPAPAVLPLLSADQAHATAPHPTGYSSLSTLPPRHHASG